MKMSGACILVTISASLEILHNFVSKFAASGAVHTIDF